ncbi:MAG: hypothetical protein WCL51_11150 [Bacteroidota bacterium]
MEKEVKKLNLNKKLIAIRNILMIILSTFFIIFGFLYGTYNDGDIASNTPINIRYGLFSFALIISATLIIIALFNKSKK